MENSFYEITTGVGQSANGGCPPDTQSVFDRKALQEKDYACCQEHGAPDLLNTHRVFNSDTFITANEPIEAGHARTWWVEPVVDNGYSYINAGTCPDCGTGMNRQGNCFSCPSCGWGCCG